MDSNNQKYILKNTKIFHLMIFINLFSTELEF